MASSPLDPPESFADRFAGRLEGRAAMTFAAFMDLALYDPVCGYYRSGRTRVARQPEADFYTAETFREVFSELVAAAAVTLLNERDPADFVFVEIGAEPGRGLQSEALIDFGGFLSFRLGERPVFPPRSVLFSNELYDAQPFHRVARTNGRWAEKGVILETNGPSWVTLGEIAPEVVEMLHALPDDVPDGATMDLPLNASRLLESQVAADWEGLFIAADYGRTWTALTRDFPEGTGRAYLNHRQHNDLLANPGRQDLTCDVCWDWLITVLEQSRFEGIRLESQEAFFMHHASAVIEKIITEPGGGLAQRQSQLKTLLHPGLMGQKFQVLSGWRG